MDLKFMLNLNPMTLAGYLLVIANTFDTEDDEEARLEMYADGSGAIVVEGETSDDDRHIMFWDSRDSMLDEANHYLTTKLASVLSKELSEELGIDVKVAIGKLG